MTGRGWASVLNTQRSNGMSESSENKRYRYFKVSAKKKLCCTSSCCTGTLSTSRMPEKPTPTSQCFFMACQEKWLFLFCKHGTHLYERKRFSSGWFSSFCLTFMSDRSRILIATKALIYHQT